MIVWVYDDENKMPVYVETTIVVGNIKVRLYKYSGLKNPITSILTEIKTAPLPKK